MKAVFPQTLGKLLCAGVLLAGMAGGASDARAQCAQPAATEGAIVYNSSESVLQYCGPTGWVAAGQDQINGFSAPIEGLVHHWKLDDNSGAVAEDSVGNADCTFGGARDTFAGKDGNALFLNNSSVNCGLIDAINGQSSFTIAAWMRREQAFDEVYIGKGTTASTSVAINAYGDGYVYFELVDSGNGSWQEGALYLDDTEWYHLVMAYDGMQDNDHNKLRTFVNGRRVSSSISGPIPETSAPGLDNLYIDANSGHIDDLRIYDRQLSDQEVYKLYRAAGGDANAEIYGASGYFVLTENVTGNLGGLSGANSYCLSELQSKEWLGKEDALANGLLTSGNVEAWLCDSSSCQDAVPYGLYTAANLVTPSSGGMEIYTTAEGYFAKESSWEEMFDQSSYFRLYTGRYGDNTNQSDTCSNFTSGSSGLSTLMGTSDTSYFPGKVAAFSTACNAGSPMICMVHPQRGCTNPPAPEGRIIYNLDANVPQYCNGNSWIAMGPTDSRTVDTEGLMAHWTMDAGSGLILEDISGNGNTGYLNGDMQWVNDDTQVGAGALSFGSEDSYVSVASSETLNLTDALSVAFWIKPRSFQTYSNILIKGEPWSFQYGIDLADNEIAFYFCTDPNAACGISYGIKSTNANLQADTWYHVTVTYDDAADDIAFYLNGTLLNEAEYTASNVEQQSLVASNHGLRLGMTMPNEELDSTLDDVRIYDYALPPQTIESLYRMGRAGSDCDMPAGTLGMIIYNDSAGVLEFCNGFDWIAIGK